RLEGARRVGGLERDHRVPVLLSDDLLQSSRARVPRPRLGRNVHRHSGHVLHVSDKLGEGQPSGAACGSAQAPTTAKITTPAVVNLMMSGASHDGTPFKTIPPAGAAASHRQGTPSARIWINMLRGRDGALSGCLGGAQDGVPPG